MGALLRRRQKGLDDLNQNNMQEGNKYIYTNRFNQTFTLFYLGGTKEVKGITYHCFKEAGLVTGLPQKGVILLTESDLKDLKKAS